MAPVVFESCPWNVQRAGRRLAERWTYWDKDEGGDRTFCGAPCFSWQMWGTGHNRISAQNTFNCVFVCVSAHASFVGSRRGYWVFFKSCLFRGKGGICFTRVPLITALGRLDTWLFNSEGAGRRRWGRGGAGWGCSRERPGGGGWMPGSCTQSPPPTRFLGQRANPQPFLLSLLLFVKLWANLLEPSAGRGRKRNQRSVAGPRASRPGAIETERREATGRFMGSNLLPTPAPKAPLPGDSLIIHQAH